MKYYEKLAEDYVIQHCFYETSATKSGLISLFIAGYLAAREGAAEIAKPPTIYNRDLAAAYAAIRQLGEDSVSPKARERGE